MSKHYTLLLILFVLYSSNVCKAQETITDYSTVYLEKLIATAKENYPRINAYKARIDIANANISKEQLSWLDAFSFTYVYKPKNTLDLNNPIIFDGYQAGVSFNLSSVLQKPANVKQAKLERKIAEYDQQEYYLTIESEVKRRYFAYLQQLNALKLQSKLVSDIQNVSRDIRTKYEKGEINFDSYTLGQNSLSTAMQNKIAIESNFLSAKALLEELLNKKLEEVL
ncbi:TolC family protein [Daejeonella lutea]|uniref:Outer membrane efflux protein n=1 Tax=Daejeonella lutea TaxID=572036 RepID=A0A1T5EF82_9SPHI|nr:TolC family protein [Daejeonella lutea]SKB82571.1 Outer membrane efflux protein [Daejeonella lutea]